MKRRNLKSIIVLFVVALVSLTATAKENSEAGKAVATTIVNGTVVDGKSGETLAGVKIEIVGSDLSTYTDFDGAFVFENIPGEDCELKATLISYNETVADVELSFSADGRSVVIELQDLNQ